MLDVVVAEERVEKVTKMVVPRAQVEDLAVMVAASLAGKQV